MCLRLNFIVEGQTEERFVNNVLRDYLADLSIYASAHCVTTRRDRRARHLTHRSGLTTYKHARDDIRRWMGEDGSEGARFTTMFDLHRLPTDFPAYADAARKDDPYARVHILETALSDEIGDTRFIPYIQLHEFEALLFADLQKLVTQFPENRAEIKRLVEATTGLSPELVNDGSETAPSKRITGAITEYARRKASAGPIVGANIGLPVLQSRCRHFRQWLERIETGCTEPT